jgi:hypothetical protein
MPMKLNCAVVNRFIEEGINLGKLESIAQFVWEPVRRIMFFPGDTTDIEGLLGRIVDAI